MVTALILGLIQGAVYGLVALGLALVYKGARVFNFAQGEFGTVAAYVAWIVIVQAGLPYPVGIVAALAAAVVMGLAMERLVVRPLFHSPRVILLVATVGVALLAISLEVIIGEATGRDLPAAIGGVNFRLFDVQIDAQEVFVLLTLVATAGGVAYFFSRTNTGLAVLASAQEPMATRIVGIRVTRTSSIVWGLAALLGGIAGVVQAPLFPFFPAHMTTVALLPGFTAAVLGGITSLGGALAGGFIVGAIQGLAQYFIGERIPGGGDLVVFFVLLGVLLLKPGGLFGKGLGRGDETAGTAIRRAIRFTKLPNLSQGDWAVRRGVLFVVAVVLIALPRLLPSFRADQVALGLIFAIIGLSINMIIGYTGQISLGHQAFVGIGAFASANLVTEQGVSFWIALPLAAATGGLAAGALGLVALRLKGLYLALITLAYGAVAERSLFGIRELTGGGSGQPAPRPPLFDSDYAYTYLCMAFLALVLYVDWRFTSSKGGRAVLAIRENENVAASYGVDVTRYKILAFVLSGIFAGLGGSLFAHRLEIVVANDFNFGIALTFVLMTVVGGLGSRTGVVIGSMFFALFPFIFSSLETYGPFVGALLLVFTLVRHPGGIGEQVEPIVRWFTGEAPGRFAVAATVGLFGIIAALGALLSAIYAGDLWGPALVIVGFALRFTVARVEQSWAKKALDYGGYASFVLAVPVAVLSGDVLFVVFGAAVPLLVQLAHRILHPRRKTPPSPPPVLQEEREPVGAA